jgi:hypothetical protein
VNEKLRIADFAIEAFYNCCREERFLVRDGKIKASCLRCGSVVGDWGETYDDYKSFLSLF